MLLQRNLSSPNKNFHDNDDDDSLTDVSLMIQPKSSSINDDPTSNYSKRIISTHDQFFQSLIAYAKSFNFDETIYSIHDLKNQFDSTKLIPSNFFSSKKLDDYNSDENTTVTDGSKFEWEYFPNTIDHLNKLQNLKNSSTPIIIQEKTKDRFLPQTIDIQVLRSPTPIIVREILPKPSLVNRSMTKNRLPPSLNTFIQNHRLSKPPIIPNDKQILSIEHYPNIQPKKIIIEYDQINITVDKNIQQRKEIKRVNPNDYIQRYKSSLYSKEAFHNLFTNIIS